VKRVFIVGTHPMSRRNAVQAVQDAPDGYAVTVGEPGRTTQANAAMWAMLADVSGQVDWYGKKLSPESWKHVFSAALKKQDVVPSLDGSGFVVLGASTSRMSKREFSDLLELIAAFGAERGVVWSEQEPVYVEETA
jgi:hypothetical protein